jgi:hypothetical protein
MSLLTMLPASARWVSRYPIIKDLASDNPSLGRPYAVLAGFRDRAADAGCHECHAGAQPASRAGRLRLCTIERRLWWGDGHFY